MTRMDTTKFIAEVNILKSRPCLNLWSRWSPWRPCWWVPPVRGVCSFHHGRCCFSTNCSNWQSSAQSLLQIWRYYLDIYIESYLYLYVHARFQNSILLFDLAKLYFISRKFIIYSPTKSLYLTPCAKIIWTKTFTTTQYHSFRLDRGCGRHPRFERHLSRGLQHTHRHCRRRRWHIAHGANGGHERTIKWEKISTGQTFSFLHEPKHTTQNASLFTSSSMGCLSRSFRKLNIFKTRSFGEHFMIFWANRLKPYNKQRGLNT